MNPQKKVTTRQQTQESQPVASQQQTPAVHEFAGVEELLRHDAAHTDVPETIARRLEDSVRDLPAPRPRSWWRRLLGGSDS